VVIEGVARWLGQEERIEEVEGRYFAPLYESTIVGTRYRHVGRTGKIKHISRNAYRKGLGIGVSERTTYSYY
jgi:hypothetical protein